MFTQEKKEPAFTDLSPMPFGKYKSSPLQDVPASYLLWLYDQDEFQLAMTPDKIKLRNYIFNSMDALKMETGKDRV